MMRFIKNCGLLVLAAATLGCVSDDSFEAATNEVENQDQVIRKLRAEVDRMGRRLLAAENEAELAKVELARLEHFRGAKADIERLQKELEDMRSSFVKIDDVTVRETAEGTALSVEGSVLFETAKDTISERGKKVLGQIAARLSQSEAKIRVDGHTDNVPIQQALDKYPLGNLQLSGARSLAVANFLIASCGLDRSRVSFAGYGEEKPVASNDNDHGRQSNRRVEIIVLRK